MPHAHSAKEELAPRPHAIGIPDDRHHRTEHDRALRRKVADLQHIARPVLAPAPDQGGA